MFSRKIASAFLCALFALSLFLTSPVSSTSPTLPIIAYQQSVQDSPATASFFLLPPLAPAPPAGDANLLDRSLLNFIHITVCLQTTGGGCTVLDTLTSSSTQEQRLRLGEDHYQANWNPPKNLRGKTVEIRVDVAGLLVGSFPVTIDPPRSLPIKFRIHNHPIVRARVLREIGKSSTFIATVLRDEFQLTPTRAAQILYGEHFNALEIGEALRDAYSQTPLQAAGILKSLTFNSVDVGNTLRLVFNQSPLDGAQILKAVGYTSLEIALALRDAYSQTPQQNSDILKALNYSSVEVATALKVVFNQSSSDVAKLLKTSGFSLTEIVTALRDAFQETATRIAQILQVELGASLIEIVGALMSAGYSESASHFAIAPQLIASYAPIIHFESSEQYLMSSVDWYLERSQVVTNQGQKEDVTRATLMSKVATLKAAGASKFWIEPKNRGTTNPGNLSTAKAYVHVYHPTSVPNEFDIQFWYFYPYNGPGRLYSRIGELWDAESSLEPLGEHVGDWEMVTIRFSDTTLTPNSEFLSAHGDFPETDWKAENLESGSHLKVYASRNGHAHYLTVGNNAERTTHVDFGLGHLDVDLYNVTGNGGQSFNSANSYEIIASEKTPVAGAEWVAFPGRWGPEEELHLNRNKAIEIVYDHLWPGAAALCGLCFIPCGVVNLICAGACCGVINGVLITIIATATDDIVDLFAKDERTANGPQSPAWNESCKNGYSTWFYMDVPDEPYTQPAVNCP